MKSYNWLGAQKVNDLKIGLCPVCNRRLAAECEHRTLESETWYAAHIVAELLLHNENADILRAARVNFPNAVLMAEHADWLDLKRTEEDARF